MNAVDINDLVKIYDNRFKALNKINLSIPKGSFFGLLGPNGAGKTTTIGILTGLVNKTSGNTKVFGHDTIDDFRETRTMIGLSPQELNFDVFFTLEELLTLQAGYYNINKKEAKERALAMLEYFNLIDKRKSRARELSGGMKRRVQIAKAFIHDPPLIILDEPTAGVDIELRYQLWDFLKTENKKGKTILLTTHYIEEAEKLCNEIAIINKGNIIANGKTNELMSAMGINHIIIDTKNLTPNLIPDNFKWKYHIEKNKLTIETNKPDEDMSKIINFMNENNIAIDKIKAKESSLEEIFINLTNDEKK
jgi:ABC-2 type transport system ATP-binding protein